MSLIYRIASRNLFQDRIRFVTTIIGIVFPIVLITIQMGLFLSFQRMVTTMIDHTTADLWIVPFGTQCFENPAWLDAHDRARALSVEGVTHAVPVVVGFTGWTVPAGGTTPVLVIGSEMTPAGLSAWNVVQGNLDALSTPHAVAVDRTYFDRLGITGIGDSTEIHEQRAEVKAITSGIRSFTTTPYVFTSLDRAQAYTRTEPNRVSYFLVHVASGTDIDGVRKRLLATVAHAEILTPDEFRSRSRAFWLFGTGAGAALFAGALLGAIVGTVIVAQTLYSSTKDHLTEFATLRAIGSSGTYLHKVIVCQALIGAVIGFVLAASVSLVVVEVTAETALPILMTPALTLGLFLLTVLMCVVSALAAMVKVMHIDPARVFSH